MEGGEPGRLEWRLGSKFSLLLCGWNEVIVSLGGWRMEEETAA